MISDAPAKHRYRFFAVAALGTFIGTLEGSILNVALPTIAADFSVEVDTIAWVVLAYQLTVVSLLMIFGAWMGRRGYAFAYKVGYLFMTIGTLVCALSESLYPLLAGRVVQAIGGAMFQAVGMGLITTVFPAEQRGRSIGMMAMVVALGLMTGPPLGGLVLEFWPWQSVFYIVLPVGAAGFGLVFWVFRGFQSPISKRKFHLGSAAALSATLLCGMLALTMLDQQFSLEGPILPLAAACLISLVIFLRLESRPESALIGLNMFSNAQLRISVTAMFLMFASIAGALILIPFYLQDVRGYSPQIVGFFLTILPVTMMIVAPLSGRLSDKIGFRTLTVGGLLLVATSLLFLAGLGPDTSATYLIACLTTLGVGVGIFNSPNTSALMGSVKAEQRSIASSIVSSTRNIGMAVGVGLCTGLFAAISADLKISEAELFAFRYRVVTLVCMGLVLIAAGFCLVRDNHLPTSAEKST